MTDVLQIGNRTIKASEILPLLANYQLLPQLLRELIIDEAIAAIDCQPEELAQAKQRFYAEKQLTQVSDIQAWLTQQGLTIEKLDNIITRKIKLEKYKQATWGPKLDAYFFQLKGKLDRVIYHLLRTQDAGLVQELYFRLQAKEQSFAEVAQKYSQGPEAQTGGLVGPVEQSTLHPAMVQLLSNCQPGQISPPTRIAEWFVIVRVEKFIPAQLDEPMKARLLNELFEGWMQEQQKQVVISH
ncbi:peptidylprolyl isomerase [Anabaena azotica]|uniref:peptidylprolyl isomerase n=1 Tax=Anabaena azotica FACHB-119 TaxID=947527 RepID=A0ABR8DF06_9NOST|nr:peptidylprolyl isomerase [Anabaena azotica]MBD2504278.1 peptidylprolyl isomerase [Anabaena azotica FACHB-119]